jgi:3-methyladenine DNA glycosylase AlkC
MAKGDLTRHFGSGLVVLLADKFDAAWPDFDRETFERVSPELEELTLMQRVSRIGEALRPCLPDEPGAAWDVMAQVLPPPLPEDEGIFGEGYWMLPLAAYWSVGWCPDGEAADGGEDAVDVALTALGELTQRGTSEFGIRCFAERRPVTVLERVRAWREHESHHVRRLCSEGTRPYLPWSGKLKVERAERLAYLDAITPLARDASDYVRRSVGNHVRDWRRIDPAVADGWIDDNDPPKDVRKLASPRKPRGEPGA